MGRRAWFVRRLPDRRPIAHCAAARARPTSVGEPPHGALAARLDMPTCGGSAERMRDGRGSSGAKTFAVASSSNGVRQSSDRGDAPPGRHAVARLRGLSAQAPARRAAPAIPRFIPVLSAGGRPRLKFAVRWPNAHEPFNYCEDTMKTIENLNVQIFADGAEKSTMLEMYGKPYIKGFTTNPTLMRKVGLTDYEGFAREILDAIPDLPISFEVFADEFDEMDRQARKIATWGKNVSVKIPITNTRKESATGLCRSLAQDGVPLNVTAIFTLDQVNEVVGAVRNGASTYVSIFAGRIADCGIDPVPLMVEAVRRLEDAPNAQLIWASPREVLNIFQAEAIGCHVITVTSDILRKLPLIGKDQDSYSLETVKMFYEDGRAAGYRL